MMRRFRLPGCSVLLASLLALRMSDAQGLQDGHDGCASLALLVRTELGAAIGHRNTHGDAQALQQDEISICRQTTRTVTAAFTASVRQRDIFVSWEAQPGGSSDYCPGLDLSQCYPTQSPNMPQPGDAQTGLVAKAWHSVRRAVNETLQPAPGSDVSRFEHSALRHDLRLSLASVCSVSSGVGIVPAD
jgi:hypothetical protein